MFVMCAEIKSALFGCVASHSGEERKVGCVGGE